MIRENHLKAFVNYLQGRKKSESTIKHYSSAVKRFYDIIQKNPENLTQSDIEIWVNLMIKKYTRQNGLNSNTLAVKFSAMKRYLRFLKINKINDIYSHLDEELLQSPELVDKPVEPLTKPELKQLIDASKKSARDYALIHMLIGTTARISEIIRLNMDDIDFKKKTIQIWDEKANKWSIRNLSEQCIDAINIYIEVYRETPKNKDENPLFLNYKGDRITYQTAWQSIKSMAVNSGIKKRIYPHLIRHSCITLMAKSGMSLLQIQTHTGHKTLKALKKYSHLTHEDIKDEVTHTLSIEKPSRKSIPKPEPQPEIITEKQPQQQETKTITTQENKDKYIELLKQGLITKEDFLKLMGIENKDENVMFG